MNEYSIRRKYLQSALTTGRFVLPVAIFIITVAWVVVYFLVTDPPGRETPYTFWNLLNTGLIPLWGNKLICLFIYFIIGYLLIQMNNTFGLIRIRASAQTSIFLLLVAACPPVQQLGPESIATLLLVIALYLLFSAYQRQRSAGYLFHAFFFVGLSSLIFPQTTLLAPILLIGAYNFQALNPRSLLAALIGWSLPYWFLFGHAFYTDNMELFYRPFIELATFCPIDFSSFTTGELAVLGYTLVIFIVSSIHCFIQSYKDKIRTRVHLRFFILLNIFIYIFIVLQPVHCIRLLPLSLVGVSILATHLFVLTSGTLSNFFFICTTLGLILLFFFNLWTLL
jgi:hypothetical protein